VVSQSKQNGNKKGQDEEEEKTPEKKRMLQENINALSLARPKRTT